MSNHETTNEQTTDVLSASIKSTLATELQLRRELDDIASLALKYLTQAEESAKRADAEDAKRRALSDALLLFEPEREWADDELGEAIRASHRFSSAFYEGRGGGAAEELRRLLKKGRGVRHLRGEGAEKPAYVEGE